MKNLKYMKLFENLEIDKKELIEKLEIWIRSMEMQEEWLNARIFAKEEMEKYLEELRNENEF